MKERPILFSGAMVNAILSGAKTQTRRVMKPQPNCNDGLYQWNKNEPHFYNNDADFIANEFEAQGFEDCPHGKPGDRLWVREAFTEKAWSEKEFTQAGMSKRPRTDSGIDYCGETLKAIYRVDGEYEHATWKPSIHMPRWASRITLEIVNVRVERLQKITEEDAQAAGATQRKSGWSMDWDRVGTLSQFAGGIYARNEKHPLSEDDISLQTARTAFANLWDKINGKKYPWSANPFVWVVEFKKI